MVVFRSGNYGGEVKGDLKKVGWGIVSVVLVFCSKINGGSYFEKFIE